MVRKNHNKEKRKSHALAQKFEMVHFKENNPSYTQSELAKKFGMSVGCVNSYLKNKKQILANHKEIQNIGNVERKNLITLRKTKSLEDGL